MRVCETEGCVVDMTGRLPHARFCSGKCRQRFNRGQAAVVTRACGHCGSDISHLWLQNKFCNDRCKWNARPGNNERQALWRQRNPDAARAARTVQRAFRKRAETLLVTERDIRRLMARHGGACAYCGSIEKIEMDHVVPLSRGGRHSIGNLLPACRRCNRGKSKKFLTEWR